MSRQIKRFRAVLEPLPGNLGWVIAHLPFDPASTWKKMLRLRVKVETGGQVFRTSLFPEASQRGYFVLVNKKMQKAAGVGLGGMIDFAIEPDLDERETAAPLELERFFKKEKALAKWYAKLSEANRRDFARWIDGVKSAEARTRRAEQAVERMLLAMDGEKVLPPVIDVAFRSRPSARKGWEQMSAVQRRGHLLGVFYYQSPEARNKRVGKVVEDCLRVAESKSRKSEAMDAGA